MKKFKILAFFLGVALILVTGFITNALAGVCCSQICDESNSRLIAAADNSPPVVAFCSDNLQSERDWNASTLASIKLEKFDAIVLSDFGELPAVYLEEFATPACDPMADLRMYVAGSVNYRFQPPNCNQSRARLSPMLARSPRDLIIIWFAAMRVNGQPSVRASPAIVGEQDIFGLLDGGRKSKTVRWC